MKRKSTLLIISLLLLICVRVSAGVDDARPVPLKATGEIVGQLPGHMQAVAVQRDYAYIGSTTEFAAIAVLTKTAPIELDRIDVGSLVHQIEVAGEYAYLATQTGLQIVNIANPGDLQWAGNYERPVVGQVKIRDDHAFIISNFGLEILSLADSPTLTPVGQYETLIYPNDLDLLDNYAFVLDGNPNRLLRVFDITDLTHPLEIYTRSSFAPRMAITHNRYLPIGTACSSICISFLTVFSWNSDPWEFTYIGSADAYMSGGTAAVETNAVYAYTGKDIGLYIYNFYQQDYNDAPVFIESFDIGDVRDIVAFDEYIYAVSQETTVPAKAGGFFILPAPPLWQTYLPVIRQGS